MELEDLRSSLPVDAKKEIIFCGSFHYIYNLFLINHETLSTNQFSVYSTCN
jgi:hypothetical protein